MLISETQIANVFPPDLLKGRSNGYCYWNSLITTDIARLEKALPPDYERNITQLYRNRTPSRWEYGWFRRQPQRQLYSQSRHQSHQDLSPRCEARRVSGWA